MTDRDNAPASLSVVIPVYNESRWIEAVIRDVVTAIELVPSLSAEIVIVDDGSNGEHRRHLAELDAPVALRVISQENQGRFGARRTGVRAARGDLVLLLDSRVSVAADALRFVYSHVEPGEPLPVWNAHVHIELRTLFARFWNVLTEVAFADYFGDPRTTSFGLDEFDRFPKGTTCFLAPRSVLLEAMESFESSFADPRNANDDTILIRSIAARQPINISPGFSCLYRSRDALGPFLRHALHRGGVFVDGYGRPGTRFFPVIVLFFPTSVAAAFVGLRRPRTALLAGIAAPLAGLGLGTRWRRGRQDIAALSLLGPLWVVAFAAGMWRGLWLALSTRVSRRSGAHEMTLG